jgi:hypothetical protein
MQAFRHCTAAVAPSSTCVGRYAFAATYLLSSCPYTCSQSFVGKHHRATTNLHSSFAAHTRQLVTSYHMNANIMRRCSAALSHVQAAYIHAHNSFADIHFLVSQFLQLVISYHMNANIMCEYSREEWVNGLSRMSCDSIDKLRAKLPELRGELRDPARFQEVYSFAFSWAREVRWVKTVQRVTFLHNRCKLMGGAEPLGAGVQCTSCMELCWAASKVLELFQSC